MNKEKVEGYEEMFQNLRENKWYKYVYQEAHKQAPVLKELFAKVNLPQDEQNAFFERVNLRVIL